MHRWTERKGKIKPKDCKCSLAFLTLPKEINSLKVYFNGDQLGRDAFCTHTSYSHGCLGKYLSREGGLVEDCVSRSE